MGEIDLCLDKQQDVYVGRTMLFRNFFSDLREKGFINSCDSLEELPGFFEAKIEVLNALLSDDTAYIVSVSTEIAIPESWDEYKKSINSDLIWDGVDTIECSFLLNKKYVSGLVGEEKIKMDLLFQEEVCHIGRAFFYKTESDLLDNNKIIVDEKNQKLIRKINYIL